MCNLIPADIVSKCLNLICRLTEESDLNALAAELISSAAEYACADGGVIILPAQNADFIIRYEWSKSEKNYINKIFSKDSEFAVTILKKNELSILNDNDTHFISINSTDKAFISIPFSISNETKHGTLFLYSESGASFFDKDKNILLQFGRATAVIINHILTRNNLIKEQRQLKLILLMSNSVLQTTDYEAQVAAICAAISDFLGFSRCSVGMVNEDGKYVQGVAAHGLPISYIRASQCPVADIPGFEIDKAIGRCAKLGITIICRDRSNDPAYREALKKKDPNKTYADEYVCIPLRAHNNCIGVITISPFSNEGHLTDEIVSTIESFASIVSLTILQAKTEQTARAAYREILSSLAAVVETRDAYTGMHEENVLMYATAMAHELKLSNAEIEAIELGAILHDVGKIAIPDMILRKPGFLSDSEFNEMKKHSTIGGKLLTNSHYLNSVQSIVKHHHERWNGSGYPDGLSGNDIPLAAQIVSIADAYDAMTTTRPYRKKMEVKAAKKELIKNAGKQFNPELIKIFLKILDNDELEKQYSISIKEENKILRIRLRGSLTIKAGREILQIVNEAVEKQQYTIFLDMTETTDFTDSGVWLLNRASIKCSAPGGMLVIAGDYKIQERISLRVVTPQDAERLINH